MKISISFKTALFVLFLIIVFPVPGNTMQSYYFYPAVNLTDNAVTDCGVRLAMDNSSDLHIAYKHWDGSDYEIYYINNMGGFWNAPEQVTNDSWDNDPDPRIAVDNSYYAHIVWYDSSDGERDIYYINNKSGSWTGLTNISDSCPGHDYNPTVAVDSVGYAHVVWFDTAGANDLYYAYDSSGGWSSPQNITNTGGGVAESQPDLAIDGEDNLYLAYNLGPPSTVNESVYYKTKITGVWGDAEKAVDNPQDNDRPSIALDSNPKSYIVNGRGGG